MISDDLTALAAISMGALASAAVTVSVVRVDPGPGERMLPTTAVVSCVVSCARVRPTVDFAIIRGEAEAMAGPEGPQTGWRPDPSLELRLLRSR